MQQLKHCESHRLCDGNWFY